MNSGDCLTSRDVLVIIRLIHNGIRDNHAQDSSHFVPPLHSGCVYSKTMEKKPLDYYKALYRIAAEVNASTGTENVLNCMVRSTAEAMGVKGCSLMLLTSDRKQLIHTAAHGLSNFYIKKGPVALSPILAEALKGNPVAVNDVTTDPRIQYRTEAIMEGIASMVSLPVLFSGEIIGVLRVYTAAPRRFDHDEIEFLSLVASLGAIALMKARQYESQGQYYEERLSEKVAQLEQADEELSALDEAKNKLLSFISMAAHDLKAPLSAIQTYFDVMLGEFPGKLNEKQREIIERSSTRVSGLFELISDLLDICRIETAEVIGERREVSLMQLITEPKEDAQRLAEEKGLNLLVHTQSDLPPIYGSVPRLQQVFTNLLSNAIKFTPEGGTITLKLSANDQQIVGVVQDTGSGIPEQDLPHVFEDFFRARNALAPGTGLGLSIVKRIIEAHGGHIEAESPCSDTGVGSKFTFTLPAKGR